MTKPTRQPRKENVYWAVLTDNGEIGNWRWPLVFTTKREAESAYPEYTPVPVTIRPLTHSSGKK